MAGDIDITVLAVIWAACAVIGGLVGSGRKIGGAAGFVLGGLLGILGLLIVLVSSRPEATSRTPMIDQIQRRHDEPGWYPDPLGRFHSRWFNGTKWTQDVGRVDPDGTRHQLEDPV